MNKILIMGLIIVPVIAFAGCMKADKSAQTNKVTEVIEKPEKLPEAVIKRSEEHTSELQSQR